jgi:hypothetical protein
VSSGTTRSFPPWRLEVVVMEVPLCRCGPVGPRCNLGSTQWNVMYVFLRGAALWVYLFFQKKQCTTVHRFSVVFCGLSEKHIIVNHVQRSLFKTNIITLHVIIS